MPSNPHYYITLTRSHPLCNGFIEVPIVAMLGILFIYCITNHPQNLVIWNNKYLLPHIFCQEFERALAGWVWIRAYQDFNHVGQDYNHLKAWLKPEDPLPRWLTHMLLTRGFSSSPGGSPHKMSSWHGQCPPQQRKGKRDKEGERKGQEGRVNRSFTAFYNIIL